MFFLFIFVHLSGLDILVGSNYMYAQVFGLCVSTLAVFKVGHGCKRSLVCYGVILNKPKHGKCFAKRRH